MLFRGIHRVVGCRVATILGRFRSLLVVSILQTNGKLDFGLFLLVGLLQ